MEVPQESAWWIAFSSTLNRKPNEYLRRVRVYSSNLPRLVRPVLMLWRHRCSPR